MFHSNQILARRMLACDKSRIMTCRKAERTTAHDQDIRILPAPIVLAGAAKRVVWPLIQLRLVVTQTEPAGIVWGNMKVLGPRERVGERVEAEDGIWLEMLPFWHLDSVHGQV